MPFKFRSAKSIELQKYESQNGYNFRVLSDVVYIRGDTRSTGVCHS